jgi:hypothetical protein
MLESQPLGASAVTIARSGLGKAMPSEGSQVEQLPSLQVTPPPVIALMLMKGGTLPLLMPRLMTG